ncbi:MAG: DUF6732 family protein [Pseudomonadota bacterium]
MRICFAAMMIVASSPAIAHPGHFAELAGHSHWIVLGALAAAGFLAAVLTGKKAKDANAADENSEDEAEEASA